MLPWLSPLLLGITGFAAGLSMLKPHKYATIGSSLRAAILAAIAQACCIGFVLNRFDQLSLFPTIAIFALINIIAGFALLVVYSAVAWLIDVGTR
jgi:hypothetical protein